MTDRYAVLGNPIAHSKSPLIHTAFARQTHQDISYEAILAPLDGFSQTIQRLMDEGYKGANITVPFKFEAYDACHQHTDRAFVAGAVNTLSFNGGHIAGDNTDGAGLVRDITHNLAHLIKGAQILMLGAGGAAQGVLKPLVEAMPAGITIANRNVEKAYQMVQRLAIEQPICTISIREFAALNQTFDLIINATSAGLTDSVLPIPDIVFSKESLAYDMMYGRETPFMAQAKAAGAQVADGLGMLVEQAAEAFYIWRNVRPDTAPVLQQLQQSLR
ncbi:MAG TPA: shikimate dehydrogenase [Methylophilus sp.]|nr:shikimate dehydrogenase [Methylophilus sp.]HQQ34157.1 shikimate dehydrogenase [Methylophilus sp.]